MATKRKADDARARGRRASLALWFASLDAVPVELWPDLAEAIGWATEREWWDASATPPTVRAALADDVVGYDDFAEVLEEHEGEGDR